MSTDKCDETLRALEAAIAGFDAKTHDPHDPDSAWNTIRLAAQSLGSEYHAVTLCDGAIDGTLRNRVAELLKQAANTIPKDVDPLVEQQIREERKTVLTMPGAI